MSPYVLALAGLVESTVALAVVLSIRRRVAAAGRHFARSAIDAELGWLRVEQARIQIANREHRHALNEHGLMSGDRIVPADAKAPAIFRPEAEEAAS